MPLEPGTRLGPYEVVGPIGAETEERYKASDTRANRFVTLKLLPSAFSGQSALKERLERDARAISSLEHPHISAPIEVGHADPAIDFIVTEFVEGETLTARLARGPMELGEALTVAVAVADSLDKAHRHGIMHGGLNPSCVMLAADGPRVLDFGLASTREDAGSIATTSMATTRASVPSWAGVPVTSAAYLAPEQYAGGAADARSDIFAFGAVLYEMLTGRRAFDEKTEALLVAAVQSVDPDPASKVQPAVPPVLDHLVARCLHKDPAQRLQTAFDLVIELQWIAKGDARTGIAVPSAARSRTRERAVWVALAAALILGIALAPSALSSFRGSPEPEEVRFTASSLPDGTTPIAISPDGRWVAAGINGGPIIGLSLDSVTSQTLIEIGSGTPVQPFFSYDSRSIAYFEGSTLKRADIGGGPPQIVCDAPSGFSAGTWNAGGVILFPAGGVIQRVLAAGGQPTPATALDQSKQETEHLGPSFLPDGRRFLFLAVSAQPGESAVYVGSLDSTERTRLFASEAKAVYAEPGPSTGSGRGYVLFNRGDTVFAQAFDADTLALSGEPIRVASGVPFRVAPAGLGTSAAITRSANFAVSQTGVLAYRTGATGAAPVPAGVEQPRSLVWAERSGASSTLAEAGTFGFAGIDLSPDDERFAVHRHEGTGGDTWVFDLSQGRMQRLTFGAGQDNSSPVWSPDGSKVAFASQRNNRWGLYVKPADGSAAEELIVESDVWKMPMSWSADGKLIVYVQNTGAGDIWAVPVAGERKPIPVLQEAYSESHAQVSPDGKWMAYQSNETGRSEIYVMAFPKGQKWQVSTDGGQWPRWRRDGKELFFYFQNSMIAAEIVVKGSSIDARVPQTLFQLPGPSMAGNHAPYHRFAVTRDGQRFLFSVAGAGPPDGGRGRAGRGAIAGGRDTIAAAVASAADRAGGPGPVTGNPITIVVNWPRMLEQK